MLAVNSQTLGEHAVYAAMIAATWAMAGFVGRLPRLIGASYVAATVAIGFVVAAIASRQPWPEPVLGDLRHVQWQITVLALWCAVTTAVCRMSRRHPATSQLLQEISPAHRPSSAGHPDRGTGGVGDHRLLSRSDGGAGHRGAG